MGKIDPRAIIQLIGEGVLSPVVLKDEVLGAVVRELASEGRENVTVTDEVLREEFGRYKSLRTKERRGVLGVLIERRIVGDNTERMR